MKNRDHDIKNYNASDIERYLNGKMSPQEMHSLERAALEDPFLAEAIEGFATVKEKNYTDTLLKLRDKIQERVGAPAKLVLIKKVSWWRAAAAIILLVAGTALVYQFIIRQDRDNEPQLALNEKVQDTVKSFMKDSVGAPGSSYPDEAGNERAPLPLPAPADRPSSKAIPHKNQSGDRDIQSVQKSFVDSSANTFEADEREDKSDAAAARQPEADGELKKETLNDELILRSEAGKKISSRAAPLSPERLAVPEIGWQKYREYLDKSKRVPVTDSSIHGLVGVQFLINSSGKLKEFIIIKSLSSALDKEAIRLVKEGPSWKRLTDKEVKTEIMIDF